ncbi:chaplin [Streptomyces sp. NPDC093252]|uniref:chaplin n=1 Tax=Streptomyces sp. NPDC093252 TaxID=3154980 RepID=UPI00341D3156
MLIDRAGQERSRLRQALSKSMVAAAAATGILSLCATPVLADTSASGGAQGSPGVVSGNSLQVPVTVPANLCGNTVNPIGLLNPAFGNGCASTDQAGDTDRGSPSYGDEDPGYGEPAYEPSYEPAYEGDSGYGDSDSGDSGYGDSGYGGDSGNRDSGSGDSGYGDSGHGDDSGYGDSGYGGDDSPGGYGEQPPGGGEQPPGGGEQPPGGGEQPPGGGEQPPGGGEQPPGGGEQPPGGGESPPGGGEQPPGGGETPPGGGSHQPPHGPGKPPSLAETGNDVLIGGSLAGAALVAGGAVLYRRGRAASRP